MPFRFCLLAIFFLSFATGWAQSGLDEPQPFAPFLNGVFPAETPGTTPGGSWATTNAFPNLIFPEPTRIVEHPREDKLAVVSKTGQIWIFTNSPETTTKELLLDLSLKTNYPEQGEGGATGFAFHPDFGDPNSPNRGYIYVAYRYTPGISGITSPEQAGFNRISRFTVPDGSSTADLNSEMVLINQYDREQWHIGGDMFFGTDRFLYIAVGDEGNFYDRTDSTQRLDGGLWSGLLRIDVDNDSSRSTPIRRQPRESSQIDSASDSQDEPRPSDWPTTFSQGYSIPLDNPFRDQPSAAESANLEEFYCIGLRHPWSISPDSVTGEIWVADVGQSQREEVDRIVKGGNHQWGFKEGLDLAGPIAQPSPLIGINADPVLDYSHTVGLAIIGAGVYRGNLFPELQGKYVFSDFENGELWAINASETGPIAIRNNDNLPPGVELITQLPGGSAAGINSHTLTRDGNLLMAKTAGGTLDGGTILKLVRQGTATPQPPALLSQTGAFQSLSSLTPSAGFIPYSLVVPFWSDNAVKTRWIAIPNNGTHDTADEMVSYTAEGDWNLPVGSVAIKHFDMVLDERNPTQTKRLETRFLINGNHGWYGVTYRWNAEGTDADLLYDGQSETLQITDAGSNTISKVWNYPSRNQCAICHTTAAGGSLGLMTRQLNKDQFYIKTGRTANQLTTLSSLGIFQTPITTSDLPNLLTLKATADTSATISQRARSYLDSNCSYCHHPGGVRANFDARYSTALNSSGLLYGSLVESLGIPGAAVVVPGNTSKSDLYQRAHSAGEGYSMPPLAKSTVDTAGMAVLATWINSLASTLGNDTSTGGNFMDAHHPSVFVDKTDNYTNAETAHITVSLTDFRFYASRLGNPITPFIATVTGTNSFTIKAIGTTRTSAEYQIGENHFTFSSSGPNTITLAPGETIVTGFMDSYPDGTGWGGGTVIPATTGGAQEDDVWAVMPNPLVLQSTGYDPSRDTPKIVLGETILSANAGKALSVYPSLPRSYKFGISYATGNIDGSGGGSSLLVNGSFESGFTGWAATGTVEIQSVAPYSATNGNQLAVFNGHNLTPNGTLSQSFATSAGKTYTLTFDAGVFSYNTNSQVLLVTATGTGTLLLSQTVTIGGLGEGLNNWLPQSFTFTANSATTILTFQDKSTESDSLDLLLDKVVVTESDITNTAPVAAADSYTTSQNTTLVIPAAGVLSNDTDAQSNPLTAVLDVGPAHGSLTLGSNGEFTYTPTADYTGADSFSYHASDGNLSSNVATVSLETVSSVLVNGSFESDFSGWTFSGNAEIQSAAPYSATHGNKLASFNSRQSTPDAVLSQSFATVAGMSYQLTFDAGNLSYNTDSQTIQVIVIGAGNLLSQPITIPGLGNGSNNWLPQSFSFTANSSSATLMFQDKSIQTLGLDLLLDNISIEEQGSSHPEEQFHSPSIVMTATGFKIAMMVTKPGWYGLESSEDLQTWTPIDKLELLEAGKVEFTGVPPPARARFYRIALP